MGGGGGVPGGRRTEMAGVPPTRGEGNAGVGTGAVEEAELGDGSAAVRGLDGTAEVEVPGVVRRGG